MLLGWGFAALDEPLTLNIAQLYIAVPAALLVVAVVVDLRRREIPDWVSIGLVLWACLAAVFGWAGMQFWLLLTGIALGSAIGVGLFRFAQFGGGDAKLIAALGAVLGPPGLLIALFWMAVCGGVLALVAIVRGQRDYAYAPAIAAGFFGYVIMIGGCRAI